MLPTLYGNQYKQGRAQRYGFDQVLNPFRQPPQGGMGGGNIGRLPPPQGGGQDGIYPPGTHQKEPPRGTGAGDGLGTLQNPFAGTGYGQPQGGGAWYRPNPVGVTASYAYAPRQMPADTYVDPNAAAYRQSMGSFAPSGDNQALWDVMPVQYKLTLSQWAAAGAGAYSQAYLDAMRAGSLGVIMDGKYMSGNEAAALIQSKANQYLQQKAQYAAQNKPQPSANPFKIGLQ